MFKIDLHIHSALGGDSSIEPDDLVPRARAVGLDAVCVTEHHSHALSAPFDEISRKSGFPIFRGMEYRAAEGHLLVFGVRAGRGDLLPGLPMQDAIDWVQARGGVAIPAHPYQKDMVGGSLGDRVLALQGLYALEVANGSVSPADNRLALQAAAMLGLKGIGGSDAHGLLTVGQAYTLFPSPIRTEKELVEALRHGTYSAHHAEQAP
ncbi:MAG: PHP domain-containing protein [Deltaproteobacteria bacterium]|nr:PHP domain-containing protein [Deltaproteobacteria bacterium]